MVVLIDINHNAVLLNIHVDLMVWWCVPYVDGKCDSRDHHGIHRDWMALDHMVTLSQRSAICYHRVKWQNVTKVIGTQHIAES